MGIAVDAPAAPDPSVLRVRGEPRRGAAVPLARSRCRSRSILLVSSGASALTTEPLQLALLVPSIALAWLITFGIMFALGCARVLDRRRRSALVNFYFGAVLAVLRLPAADATSCARSSDRRRRRVRGCRSTSCSRAPVELMTQAPDVARARRARSARSSAWAVACVVARARGCGARASAASRRSADDAATCALVVVQLRIERRAGDGVSRELPHRGRDVDRVDRRSRCCR